MVSISKHEEGAMSTRSKQLERRLKECWGVQYLETHSTPQQESRTRITANTKISFITYGVGLGHGYQDIALVLQQHSIKCLLYKFQTITLIIVQLHLCTSLCVSDQPSKTQIISYRDSETSSQILTRNINPTNN